MEDVGLIIKIARVIASDEIVFAGVALCWGLLIIFVLYSTCWIIRETYYFLIKPPNNLLKRDDKREKLFHWLAKKFGIDWIVFNYRQKGRDCKIVIAPYCDKTDFQEEILKKEIPFGFLMLIKMLYPGMRLVVRGLITDAQIESDRAYFSRANLCHYYVENQGEEAQKC